MQKFSCSRSGRTAIAIILISAAATFGQILDRNNNNDDDATAQRDRARAAALATARGQVQRAETLLNVALQRVQANWKANPQYTDAVKERQDANKAFMTAKGAVVAKLKGDPQYSDANHQVANAAGDVRAEQEKTNATQPAGSATVVPPTASPEQVSAAQDKLDAKSNLRKMEDDAVAADADAAKAQARLAKADADLQLLQAQLKAALLNDPDYKSALDQLTAAKAQVAQAAGSY